MFNYFTKRESSYGGTELVPNIPKMVGHTVLALIVLVLLFGSFGVVGAGERGVRVRMGNIVRVYEPGLYFKLPLVEKMVKMEVRTRTVQYELEDPLFAASKDLQDVQVATVINYHLDPTAAAIIYQQYGTMESYETNVIRPAVRDTVKTIASNYTAEELVTKRSEYNDAVNKALSDRLTPYNIAVERVNITNLKFSDSFTQSIEAKVTAQQQALKAENDLARVEFEAKQQIERAKAEAESIRIQAQAVTQQGGKDYVQLKAIEKWNGALPTQMVPGATVPFLNLTR